MQGAALTQPANAFAVPVDGQRQAFVIGAVLSGIMGGGMMLGSLLLTDSSAGIVFLIGIGVSIISCAFCCCICCQQHGAVFVNQTHLGGAPAFPLPQPHPQHAFYPAPVQTPPAFAVPTAEQVTSAHVPRTSV